MALLENIIAVFTPYNCLGCGAEGRLICALCSRLFPEIPPRCYRCRRHSEGNRTCHACRKSVRLGAVRVVTDYHSVAKELVWRLKFNGSQAAARVIAEHMGKLCEEIATDCVIVHVPTTAKRTRQRGYDQAKLIAGELSRITGLPRFDCLARSGKARQVGASRAERLKQLQAAFRLKKPVAGKHIVLIDDVVTTGATLEAAAKVLHVNGASSVHAIVFAQP